MSEQGKQSGPGKVASVTEGSSGIGCSTVNPKLRAFVLGAEARATFDCPETLSIAEKGYNSSGHKSGSN